MPSLLPESVLWSLSNRNRRRVLWFDVVFRSDCVFVCDLEIYLRTRLAAITRSLILMPLLFEPNTLRAVLSLCFF